jgi:hypothetical protein
MLKKLFGSLFGNKASEAPKPPSPSLPDIPPSDSLPNTKAPVHGISYPEFLGDRRDTGYIKKFKTKVVGVTHENVDGSSRQDAIGRLRVGQKVRLVWEKDNPHDPNAILLFPGTTGNVKMKDCVGYLKADLAADMVNWVTNTDWCVYAEVAEILGGYEGADTLGCLLEITVYSEVEPTPTPIPGASVVSPAAEPSPASESEPRIAGLSTKPSRSIDTGKLTVTPDGAWILNPNCGFRLTIETGKDVAVQVKALLDSRLRENLYDGEERLAPIIARSNLRCREIEEYVCIWRPRYLKRIEELKAASEEWATAGEMDRDDLLAQFKGQALAAIDVRPRCDLDVLLDSEPVNATIDDALVDRYGFDAVDTYLQHIGKPAKVHRLAPTHPQRQRYESLLTKGLARRGSDIPVAAILADFKLKEMAQLAPPGLGPFGRKAAAIQALTNVPDIRERLGKVVAFRELFQLLPLPEEFAGIDLGAVGTSWAYTRTVTNLFVGTYMKAAWELRSFAFYDENPDLVRGWEVRPGSKACPYCVSKVGRVPSSTPRPRVPFHIGCYCDVVPV